jgi:hypothetical protein
MPGPIPAREAAAAKSPGSGGRGCERLGFGQRVPTANPRRCREVVVHVEERRARDVPLEIELASAAPVTQVPPAIDELVAHRCSVTRTSFCGVLDRTFERSKS